MSIQSSMKWLVLAGAGFLVSGCVAPPPYSPSVAPQPYAASNVAQSDEGLIYSNGEYYEVVEAYDEPYYGDPYYYAPHYGSIGTTLYYNSHIRHRHVEKKHKSRSDLRKKKSLKRSERKLKNKVENKVSDADKVAAREERRAERLAARQAKRDERQAACQEAGFENCKAQNRALRAERRSAKQDAGVAAASAKSKRKLLPANKRRRGKRTN